MKKKRVLNILKGDKFGLLTVLDDRPTLYKLKTRKNAAYLRKCRCICGKIIYKANGILHSKNLIGCIPCTKLSISAGEGYKNIANNVKVMSKINSNWIWKLSPEQTIFLISQNCHYCGSPPNNVMSRGPAKGLHYSGIDRINSNKGYITTNVVSCCIVCNRMKSNLNYGIFISHMNKICTKFYLLLAAIDIKYWDII